MARPFCVKQLLGANSYSYYRPSRPLPRGGSRVRVRVRGKLINLARPRRLPVEFAGPPAGCAGGPRRGVPGLYGSFVL
eukprot:6514289-Pyramimonas_sp.AAC.1